MPTIAQHIDEIRNLDVENHTISGIKKDNWAVLDYPEKNAVQSAIFTNDEISLSRANVKAETDIKTKIMKVLMWGYKMPNGGLQRQYADSIVQNLPVLETVFAEIKDKNLNAEEIKAAFDRLGTVKGLGAGGISTNSKLFYFFNVSFEGHKCLILDRVVAEKLNLFDDFAGTEWKPVPECYSNYLSRMDELSRENNVSPEQLELFLFGYQA